MFSIKVSQAHNSTQMMVSHARRLSLTFFPFFLCSHLLFFQTKIKQYYYKRYIYVSGIPSGNKVIKQYSILTC